MQPAMLITHAQVTPDWEITFRAAAVWCVTRLSDLSAVRTYTSFG
jgi:hypothetical protein